MLNYIYGSTLTCCVLHVLVAMHDCCFAGEVGTIMSADDRHAYPWGSTKSKAKICHSYTVNRWATIVFAPFLLHE